MTTLCKFNTSAPLPFFAPNRQLRPSNCPARPQKKRPCWSSNLRCSAAVTRLVHTKIGTRRLRSRAQAFLSRAQTLSLWTKRLFIVSKKSTISTAPLRKPAGCPSKVRRQPRKGYVLPRSTHRKPWPLPPAENHAYADMHRPTQYNLHII